MPAQISVIITEQKVGGGAIQSTTADLHTLAGAADSTGGRVSGFFGNMMAAAGGFLAANVIGKIASAFSDFISGGMEDARATAMLMASTEQTIKTMGNAAGVSAQHVADMASALSDAAGKSLFGDDQIQQSENLLLTFGNIKGAVFDTATALTVDLAAALGGAPADSAMMLGKALNDPIKGMTALGKAGLTFSEEQKAAIKAMQDSGDIAGAQAIIIAELTRQVGGQAAAQAAAAGGWVQFKARMGEAAETMATGLLPVLDKLANFMNAVVMPVIENAVTAFAGFTKTMSTSFSVSSFSSVFTTLQALGTAAGRWILDALPGFLTNIVTYRERLFSGITEALPRVLAALAPLAAAAGRWILDALPGMLASLGAFFQAIVNQTITYVPRWVATLAQFGIAAAGWVVAALPGLLSNLGVFLTNMLNWVVASLPRWGAELGKLAMQIQQWVVDALPGLGTNLGKALGVILGWIVQTVIDVTPKLAVLAFRFLAWVAETVIPALPGVLLAIATALYNFIAALVSEVGPKLVVLGQKFYTWISETVVPALPGEAAKINTAIGAWLNSAVTWAGGELAKLGQAMIDGIIQGIQNGAAALYASLTNLANSALQAAKDAILAHSPSERYATEVGLPMAQGIAVGVDQGAPLVDASVARTVGDSAAIAASAAERVGAVVPPAMGKGYTGKVGEFTSAVKSGLDATFRKTMEAAISVGAGLADGMAQGMFDNASAVSDAAGDVAQGAIDNTKDVTGTHSPSTVFMEIGRALIEGLVDGIVQMAPTVDRKLLDTFGQAMAAILGALSQAVGAIADLQGFAGVSLVTVQAFVANVNMIMNEVSAVARGWLPHRTEIVGMFTDMAGGVFDAVKSGLDAFDKMAKLAPVTAAQITTFANNMTLVFDFLVARIGDWDFLMLGTAAAYLDIVGQLLSAISDGADAFTALQGIVAIQSSSVTIFVQGVTLIIRQMMAVVGQFEADGVVAAATFAESAGQIIGIIGQGVEGFTALADFGGVSSATVDSFALAVNMTVTAFVQLANDFEASSVEAASVFSSAAGDVVSIIGDAVSGFTALASFGGVMDGPISALSKAIDDVLASFANYARLMSEDTYAAATAFATGAGSVIAVVGDAVSGFTALADFTGVMDGPISALTKAIDDVLASFANYARIMSVDTYQAARAFADGAGAVVAVIGDAVEGFTKLGDFTGVSSGIIQAFADGLNALLTQLRTVALPAATSMGAQIVQGIIVGFQSQIPAMITSLVAAVQQAVGAARTALGIASPSKLMADQIGIPMAQGIAVGVGAGAPAIASAIGAATTINNYSISYGSNVPSSGSVASDIRLLTMLGAGAS